MSGLGIFCDRSCKPKNDCAEPGFSRTDLEGRVAEMLERDRSPVAAGPNTGERAVFWPILTDMIYDALYNHKSAQQNQGYKRHPEKFLTYRQFFFLLFDLLGIKTLTNHPNLRFERLSLALGEFSLKARVLANTGQT